MPAFLGDKHGYQGSGSDAQIRSFCDTTYRTSFPLLAKIEMNGPRASPVHVSEGPLAEESPAAPSSSFTKFLVGHESKVLGRIAPTAAPDAIAPMVEIALAASAPAAGRVGQSGLRAAASTYSKAPYTACASNRSSRWYGRPPERWMRRRSAAPRPSA